MRGDLSPVLIDGLTERALQAVARRRALGMHFIGHFLGLDGEPTGSDGVARLRLPAWPDSLAPASEPVSDVEWGVLADLAMAQAIREQLTVGGRLATSTLVVHQIHHQVARPVEAHGSVAWIDAELRATAVRVEMVDALFAVNGSTLMPTRCAG